MPQPQLALVATLMLLAPSGPRVPPSYVARVLDREVPLELDGGEVAVWTGAGAAPAAELLAPLGQPRVRAHSVPGWHLVEVPPERDAAEVVGQLADRAGEGFVSPIFRAGSGGPQIVTPYVLVGFRAGIAEVDAEAVLSAVDGVRVLERRFGNMEGAFRLRCASRNGFEVLALANSLALRADVLFAEPDYLFSGHGHAQGLSAASGPPAVGTWSRPANPPLPDDPQFDRCWPVHNAGQTWGEPGIDLDGPEAWQTTFGDPSVLVVVIDTGVDQAHEDLNLFPGADFTSQGPGDGGPVDPCDNHGTRVAGCVSAVVHNGTGIAGIAPGCKVASARTMMANSPCGTGWSGMSSWTVNALAWAESIGARVTNNSNGYGLGTQSGAIQTKYEQTRAAGMVHFASAGNAASTSLSYPASLDAVLAIGAVSKRGGLWFSSNYGPDLDLVAPGHQIRTTDRMGSAGAGGNYITISGTSFASPYAAGVAALVLSEHPELGAPQVESLLRGTALDLYAAGFDEFSGWGLVNAHGALHGCKPLVTALALEDPGGNRGSIHGATSEDGGVVAFDSWARNLVDDDGNGFRDVFVRDLGAKPTVLASRGLSGAPANGDSFAPSLSEDGRWLAFLSEASDLVTGDTNALRDAFVLDRLTGVVTRVSVDSAGVESDGRTLDVAISGDGTVVAFSVVGATTLWPTATAANANVYWRDLQTGTTGLASIDPNGFGAIGGSSVNPSLSDDGRYIAFQSDATTLLLAGDFNMVSDVFVHDRQTALNVRVSVGPGGVEATGPSYQPSISADGGVVAFCSIAANLLASGGNTQWNVYAHDLGTATTTRVSESAAGVVGDGASFEAWVSDDGSLVAFESRASNLAAPDTNDAYDVLLKNRTTGSVSRVSVDSSGGEAWGDSTQPRLTGDGRYLLFSSEAADLSPADTNQAFDVFRHDLATGQVVRVSLVD